MDDVNSNPSDYTIVVGNKSNSSYRVKSRQLSNFLIPSYAIDYEEKSITCTLRDSTFDVRCSSHVHAQSN